MFRAVILLLILTYEALAQHHRARPTAHLPYYDDKSIHFGFLLAMNNASYTLNPTGYFYASSDTLKRVEPFGTGGFTVGPLINLRLTDHLDLRGIIQFSLYQRGVSYTFLDKTTGALYQDRQSIEASFVEVPILLKYKSQRRGNFRMYIVGGAKAGISTSNKNKDQRPDKLRLKSFDLAIDYGLGCDLYFPLFKFSPELRFSNGLIDMKAPDQNKYAKAVQNLRSKTITLVLNFE